ncbi:MAG: DNA mismatch repair endonuclease MutL [Spirochaetota bacterium]
MGVIKTLENQLINKIAAGEVIESPHSVIKELLENSLDAGSSEIAMETTSAGIEEIVISDNGSGIAEDDLELAIRRHATSKIHDLQDLESILTFGFRGEALSSIAAISEMEIVSGTSEVAPAWKFTCKAGKILGKEEVAPRKGTRITVRNLFFNAPVRRKFLKSERAEEKKIRDRIATISLSYEDSRIRYRQNDREIFQLSEESKKERIISVFGESIREHLLEVFLEKRGIKAYGFISDPDFYKSNRSGQFLFVNNRNVEIKYTSQLLKKAYDELLPANVHPWCFLFFEIDPSFIDVNVHPAKKEIRFLDEQSFTAFFLELVYNKLRSSTPVTFLEMKHRLSAPLKKQINTKPSATAETPPLQKEFASVLQNGLYETSTPQKPFELENVGAGNQIEALTDAPKIHREFIPKRHYGVIFETFILAEADDGLYIIDQHTAHERIRYEEVLREYQRKGSLSQPLLTPIRMDLSIQEAEEILERRREYESIGLYLDDLGEGTLLIREVPVFVDPGKEKETTLDFLERTKKSHEPELYDLMAKSIACRSAIKKGDLVSDHILGEVLNRLSLCENPSRCPHGRPTLIKLTRYDLERMFHRVP